MPDTNSKLALFGGVPVCSEALVEPAWPPICETTAQRLKDVYLSGQWSFNSPSEQEFARAFADYHDAKHGIFMANGTVTLQCALAACGVGPGDEVIVPALTWMATAMAVHYVGAKPVFVDIEPDTLCLDPKKTKIAITDKTKAIIPVHLYASMADLEAILDIAGKHGLTVIEDCAHMHGGKWNGRGVGSWGRVGSFSFQQSKTLSSGEGGICITDDDELVEKLYRMKHIGYATGLMQGQADNGPPDGLVCYNFRATAFQAVILSDQLKELEGRIERYGENAARIEARLAGVPGVRIQARGRLADPQGYYCMTIIFDGEQTADMPLDRIGEALKAEGLALPRTYGPVYKHILYNLPTDSYRIDGGSCLVAEKICAQQAFVLMHQWLAGDEKTIDAIGEIIAKVALNAAELQE